MSRSKPRIAFLMPEARRGQVFTPAALDRLRSLGEVVAPEGDSRDVGARLPDVLPGADACLTGWGTPRLAPELLAKADRLRIIAHSAGSIKSIIPVEAFDRGIVVCHAADVIAEAVSECTLTLMLTGLRQFHLMDQAMKAGRPWAEAGRVHRGRQLAGKTVGLVGCGYVARRVVGLLKPFGVRVLVYDPYLSAERAAELGVIPTSLDAVFAESDVVSNHAPTTPETRHLIGARQLALLREGAVFVNTARAWPVDQEALLRELRTGRFWAALDVFEPEPLPEDSEFLKLDNVFLTPHQAGHTVETNHKQGMAMVEELERFFAGEPLRYQVAREAYGIMA